MALNIDYNNIINLLRCRRTSLHDLRCEEVASKSFDYIIVGGGSAGGALAATLCEKFSVLLVERGGSPYGNPLVLD